MHFYIKKNTLAGRIGDLVLKSGQFQTPFLLQTTKSGSVPYLSREVFEYITKDVQFLQMSLSTMSEMAESLTVFDGSLSSYVGFEGHCTFLTIRDTCKKTPEGFNDKNVVPLFTRQGEVGLTAKRYMELIQIFSPDIYQSFCDGDTNIDSANKRTQKSVERSSHFFNYCYEMNKISEIKSAFFASIVGGYNKFERTKCIKHIHEKTLGNFDGYIFEGFHNNGVTATSVKLSPLLDVVSHCLNQMTNDKPKVIIGAYGPLTILELIRMRIDIFDSSYCYVATINFKALTFNFDLDKITQGQAFLEISDESIREDFEPILTNCTCYTCKKHTKAYIYHLYNTKELLGSILLMIHNIYHYMKFFEAIRKSINDDKLDNLIQLIKYQNTESEIDYSVKEIGKHVPKTYIDETMDALEKRLDF